MAADGQGGLRTCALRPHLIWGPRDPHLVPRLLARARAGQLRRVGDGQNLMDVIYVENAALAHLQAADRLEAGSPVCGRAYFLGQEQPVNCWGWINQLLEMAGLPPVECSISLAAAWRIGADFGVGASTVAAAGRAAHDAFPGRSTGPIALLRHAPRRCRFWLYSRGFRSPKGCNALRILSPTGSLNNL